MSSVCIGSDSRNMHTHTVDQGHRDAGLRPLCLGKSQVLERVLASNPAMSSVCMGSESRNMHTHTFEQGHHECRPKASVSQVASIGASANK